MIIYCWRANCSGVLPSGHKAKWAAAGARYLLGYNEPDGATHPHSVAPAEAARWWPQLQDIAAAFDPPLELVSPALSGSGMGDNGTSQWLDEFLGNCSAAVAGCRPELIKYVAFHDYHGTAERILSKADGVLRRYGRRSWVTEFAVGHGKPRARQDKLVAEALPALEAAASVHRYAWYSSRNGPSSWVTESNLLPYNSSGTEVTSTGALYAAGP